MMPRSLPPISPLALGATLYMPAIRPDLDAVLRGTKLPDLRSLVLCLEDALHERDVEAGIANIRHVLERLAAERATSPAALFGPPPRRPLIFLRPRHLAMALELPRRLGPIALSQVDGLVAPKIRADTVAHWAAALAGTHLLLMPTLETAETFDPGAVAALRDAMLAELSGRVLALRIGGNDLLSTLALRRRRGATLYEGPLGYAIGMLVGLLAPAGFALTAPVCEIVDDPALLAAEVAEDVAHGLVGKTAIHPAQLAGIHDGFRVTRSDLDAARRILGSDSAVFLHDGAMCEPATHRNWAKRIEERASAYGVKEGREAQGGALSLPLGPPLE